MVLNLYDSDKNYIGENKFALMENLAVDILIDVHFLVKYQLQSKFHTRDIIFENNDAEFRLSRIRPRPIKFCNNVIRPGWNSISVAKTWKNTDTVMNISMNHDNLDMYEQILQPSTTSDTFFVYNKSPYFYETNDIEHCFELTEAKQVSVHKPFHYRKTLRLPRLQLNNLIIGSNINVKTKRRLETLIKEYDHIFSRAPNDIGKYCGNMTYRIELSNPIVDTYAKQKFSQPEQNFIAEELKKMLDYDIIEKVTGQSRVYCGIIVAKKKLESGQVKLRFCLASNLINRETKVADNYPLPEITEVIQRLSGQKFYTQLDMNSAYWQIIIPPDQRYLYTFEFQGTVYQFTRSSYGTRGMPSFFSALMFSLVGHIDGVSIYLDDVTIASKNIHEHFTSLGKVFEIFSKYNLTLGLAKCNFVQNSITSFGYIVNQRGYEPCPKRIEKLRKLKSPQTLKEVQSRLGALNYFCHTIKNFKVFAEPFYQLKKGFEPTPELENKWDKLLEAVANCFLRIKPDYNAPIRIVTDSSDLGGGVCMTQEKNGKWYPVLIDSFIHKGRVRLARISYKEFAVVFRTFKKHKRFILCFPSIELLCDNRVTVCLLDKLHSVEILKRSAPCSWLMFLSHFNFSVRHISGTSNEMLLSDLLSRSNMDFSEQSPRFTLGQLKDEECLEFDYFNASVKIDDVLKASKSFDYEKLRNLVKQKQIEHGYDEDNAYLHRVENIVLPNKRTVEYKIIYHKSGKLVCPPEFIREFLTLTHVHGQPTIWFNMVNKLDVYFYGIKAKMAAYKNSCVLCSSINPRRTLKEQTSVMATSQIGELYHVDVVHINSIKVMMAIDHFSNYLIMTIIEDEKDTSIRDAFYEIFFQLLIPQQVVTDNHQSFRSKMIAELMENLNVHHRFITPRWSSANGKIERAFRSVRNILKIFEVQDINLKTAIKYSVFVINNKRSAKAEFTPFEVVTLRSSIFPFNMPYYSLSRLEGSSTHSKKFIESAREILNDIRAKKLADLEDLTDLNTIKLYQKGDIVIIRAYPVKGLSSKILSYYDTTEFIIVEVVRRAKTYVIEKLVEDERIQKQRFRIAHNLVRRIRKADAKEIDNTDKKNETENEATTDEQTDEDSENGETEEESEITSEEEQSNGDQLDNEQRRIIQGENSSTQPEGISRRGRGASRYNLRILK